MTIIVPVFNGKHFVLDCLRGIQSQTYAARKLEIIWVDNGSTDETKELLLQAKQRVEEEIECRSSYAARNTGIRVSQGDILAFTDADCVPCPGWIEEGVRALMVEDADLVSGNVRFLLSSPPTGAELWDAVTNMQISESIAERGVSKTANLIVRREVFERIGCFPAHLQSGGDVLWTGRATRAGCKLVYHGPAEVAHPGRRMWPLIQKQYRVGIGRASLYNAEAAPLVRRLWGVFRGLLPRGPGAVARLLREKGYNPTPQQVVQTTIAAWLARTATALGTLVGFFRVYRASGGER